jgi:hypothetical protein
VSAADPPTGAGGNGQALAALGNALDQLGVGSVRVLAEAAVLLRAYPRWAVWLAANGREWTAVRPAGSMAPGPEAPMIWVRAETAGQLAVLMQRANQQLPD